MTPFPPYSFFEEAAAEARAASRRYWAKGGEADRRFPVRKTYWYIRQADDSQQTLDASLERHRGRGRSR